MKIQIHEDFKKAPNSPEDIEQLAVRKLDGSDYDSGQLETIERTAKNNSAAIGRLLDLLAAKGQISAEEILQVLGVVPHNLKSAALVE